MKPILEVKKDLSVLRAQALLFVVCRALNSGERVPSQGDLMWVKGDDNGGLLNEFWREAEIDRRYPTSFTSNSHINAAAHLLSDNGLMVPRGTHQATGSWTASHYQPTPEGEVYAKKYLLTEHWTEWPQSFADDSERG